MRSSRLVPITLVVLLAAGGACSSDGDERAVAVRRAPEGVVPLPTTTVAEPADVPDHGGDPGDILTLSNIGTATTMVTYTDHPQMRDYSEATVVATLVDTIARPESGVLELRLHVDEQVGGREPVVTDDGVVSVVVPLDGDEAATERVLARIEPLLGEARYLMFLFVAAVPELPDAYGLDFYSGPEPILSFWPGDGRLTRISGRSDLFADAIARGEELTGTSSLPDPEFEPTFVGEAPIGLTLDEVRLQFARPVGDVETEPPIGWDDYLELLESIRSNR